MPIQFHTCIMPLLLFIHKVPKRSDCFGVLFFFHTSLHHTMVLLGWADLGTIQGCLKAEKMAFDFNAYTTCYRGEPGAVGGCVCEEA